MSFSRRCTANTLCAAARPRRLLRPTTAVIPIWLYHGERQGATIEEGRERSSGWGRKWGAGIGERGGMSRFSPTACGHEKEGGQMSGPACLSPLGPHVDGPTRHGVFPKLNEWEEFWPHLTAGVKSGMRFLLCNSNPTFHEGLPPEVSSLAG
jgi:hypothetical protein